MAQAPQVNNKPHTPLAAYAEAALQTNQLQGGDARDQLRFGLFGEVGSLLSLVKKEHRDLETADHNAITEEIGDALWYLANVAAAYETSLSEAGAVAMQELQTRLNIKGASTTDVTFEELDALLQLANRKLPELGRPKYLRELAAHAGQLLSTDPVTTDLLTGPAQTLLGHILADLAMVAMLFQQKLAEIAEANLQKIRSRWPGANPKHLPLFDEESSELEQFPREFNMEFIEVMPHAGGTPHVIQRLHGINIGDRLTDNRADPDGYRFHDVFHLAYMVHLGWSPVIRGLLKIKRKSNPDVDENEDGARATIIEEAVSTWIFNHAHMRGYFANKPKGRLNYELLKQVHNMVNGYEAAKCPLWQWELAILEGFAIFRALMEHGGGLVKVNLNTRTLQFECLELKLAPKPGPVARPPLIGALPPADV